MTGGGEGRGIGDRKSELVEEQQVQRPLSRAIEQLDGLKGLRAERHGTVDGPGAQVAQLVHEVVVVDLLALRKLVRHLLEVLVVIGLVAGLFIWSLRDTAPEIANNSVLVLKISGSMPDYAPEDPFAARFFPYPIKPVS